MKKIFKKTVLLSACAISALSLTACNMETPESSFVSPLPWASYEKLCYDVQIFDTTASEAEDKRVLIAGGELTFTLDGSQNGSFTALDMDWQVTYLDIENAGDDRGKTDTITSSVEFETNSLAAKTMTKSVNLQDRKDTQNLSYTVSADYFGTHEAKFKYSSDGEERTMALPQNICRDNEMMFYLARAVSHSEKSADNFRMLNLFDCFNAGEFTEYRMVLTEGADRLVDIGDWVKDYGVEAVTDEKSGKVSYPVKTKLSTISINATNRGPAYNVLFSVDPFVKNEKSHAKVPIEINYSVYRSANPARYIKYTLNSCEFEKTSD